MYRCTGVRVDLRHNRYTMNALVHDGVNSNSIIHTFYGRARSPLEGAAVFGSLTGGKCAVLCGEESIENGAR